MEKILVTGAVGQIGSELTMELRKRYGNENVVAGIHRTQPGKKLRESGPFETVDCSNAETSSPIMILSSTATNPLFTKK